MRISDCGLESRNKIQASNLIQSVANPHSAIRNPQFVGLCMKKSITLLIFSLMAALASSQSQISAPSSQSVTLAAERHLRNVRQLSFGGQNAEAYFSGDGRQLIF